eukprot:CAMPEP_0116567182 /NCGR_PEP_ID=MMETSP0397-20121206/14859_1 /TAXON_ID=216820 /ORGANISM="Cyclophora tenuis, Strain ECT3854" /LENGTH=389 /DNA_ID=CAMNT_0004094133 /DNA_START=93 /DNA_END=1262 /DNA_ORIENTATION=+
MKIQGGINALLIALSVLRICEGRLGDEGLSTTQRELETVHQPYHRAQPRLRQRDASGNQIIATAEGRQPRFRDRQGGDREPINKSPSSGAMTAEEDEEESLDEELETSAVLPGSTPANTGGPETPAESEPEIPAPEPLPSDPENTIDTPNVDGSDPILVNVDLQPGPTDMSAPEPEPINQDNPDNPDTPTTVDSDVPPVDPEIAGPEPEPIFEDTGDIVDVPTNVDGESGPNAKSAPTNTDSDTEIPAPEPIPPFIQDTADIVDTPTNIDGDTPMSSEPQQRTAGGASLQARSAPVVIGRPGYQAYVCAPNFVDAKEWCVNRPVCKYKTEYRDGETIITTEIEENQGDCVRRCDSKYGLTSAHCGGLSCFSYVTECKCASLDGEGCQPY